MTGRRRIELDEHEAVDVPLSQEDLRGLLSEGAKAVDVTPTLEKGTFRIKAKSRVGMLSIGEIDLLIHPKIPLQNVFVLMEPARVPLDLRSEVVGYGAYDEITPAFAAFFARLLEHTLARGMRRDYVLTADDLVAVRGRIDLSRAVRSPVATPLACRFEEHTLDTPHHRLLKAAALRLVRLQGIGDRNRETLRHLLMWFGEVGDCPPPPQAVLRKGFTRLDAYYEPAVRLAALVLDRSSLRDSFGEVTASGFLIDMNKVFETFVETRLADALAGDLVVRGQAETHLDVESTVRMVPDLVFEKHGVPVYVGDAKYKLTDELPGVDADLYQLLAYATALGLDEGVLVYAHAGEAVAPEQVQVRGAGTRLWARRLPLHGSPAFIRSEISRLAEWIADRAASSRAHAA